MIPRWATVADAMANDATLIIRLPKARLAAWRAAAAAAGVTVSEYVRRRVDGVETITIEAPAPATQPKRRKRS